MKKLALSVLLALTLLPAASFAQVVIQVRPPVAIVEQPGPRPGAEFVWVGGYHRWDGAHYVWVPGRWDRPPHPHAVWVRHHYVRRGGGWVLVEGHWR